MRLILALLIASLVVVAGCNAADNSTPQDDVTKNDSVAGPVEIEPDNPLPSGTTTPQNTLLETLASECSSRDDDVFQGCSFTACKVRPTQDIAGLPTVYCPVVVQNNRLVRVIESEVPGGVERTTVVVENLPSGETPIPYPGEEAFATVYYVFVNESFLPVASIEALARMNN